jgi:hypothetical protein
MSATPITTSTLLKAISDSDDTIMFAEVGGFPLTGATILIGTEQITYSANVNGTLYGCTRGANSTAPAAHSIGAVITLLNLYAAVPASIPDPLPAVSGENLTDLNASELTSGTLPDATFPAVLPAVSGANLTNLPSGGGSLIKATKFTINSAFLPDDNSYVTIASVDYTPVSATAIVKVTASFLLSDLAITANGDIRLTNSGNVLTSQAYNVTAWSCPQTMVGFYEPAGAAGSYALRARCTNSTPAGGFSTGSEQIFLIEEIEPAA